MHFSQAAAKAAPAKPEAAAEVAEEAPAKAAAAKAAAEVAEEAPAKPAAAKAAAPKGPAVPRVAAKITHHVEALLRTYQASIDNTQRALQSARALHDVARASAAAGAGAGTKRKPIVSAFFAPKPAKALPEVKAENSEKPILARTGAAAGASAAAAPAPAAPAPAAAAAGGAGAKKRAAPQQGLGAFFSSVKKPKEKKPAAAAAAAGGQY